MITVSCLYIYNYSIVYNTFVPIRPNNGYDKIQFAGPPLFTVIPTKWDVCCDVYVRVKLSFDCDVVSLTFSRALNNIQVTFLRM